jgi:exosortase
MRLLPTRADRWTAWHVVAALFMAAAGVWATRAAWADIHHIASVDPEYSHVFLVPLVAFWMVWVRRMRFRHCRPTGMLLGPIIAAAGWAVSSYGYYHAYQSLWHFGSVLVVVGCVTAVLGKHVLARFFPAVAVLIFMIPVPGRIRQQIAQPLQTGTATIAQKSLQMVGVDAERSGNALSINGREVTIAEACNGVRGIFALTLVSYAFGFGMPLRNSIRFLILLASPIATIFCNLLRILPTAWLHGYHSKTVAEQFHDQSGWLMVPVAFLLLLGIIKLLQWATVPVMRYRLAS